MLLVAPYALLRLTQLLHRLVHVVEERLLLPLFRPRGQLAELVLRLLLLVPVQVLLHQLVIRQRLQGELV